MKQLKAGSTTIDIDDTECEYCNQEVDVEEGRFVIFCPGKPVGLGLSGFVAAEAVHFDCHDRAQRAIIAAAGEAEASLVLVRNFAHSVGDAMSETEALRLIRSQLPE